MKGKREKRRKTKEKGLLGSKGKELSFPHFSENRKRRKKRRKKETRRNLERLGTKKKKKKKKKRKKKKSEKKRNRKRKEKEKEKEIGKEKVSARQTWEGKKWRPYFIHFFCSPFIGLVSQKPSGMVYFLSFPIFSFLSFFPPLFFIPEGFKKTPSD